jgi:hypothetical protein
MSSEISLIELLNNVKKVFHHLISKWKPILIISSIVATFGVVKTWLEDPTYTAEMTFVTEGDKSGGLGGYASIAAQFGLDIGGSGGGGAFAEDNLMELLKSRNLVDKTLLSQYDNNLFIDQYIINHKINKGWDKDSVLSKVSFSSIKEGDYNRKRDSIFNKIADGIIKSQLDVDKIDKKLDITYIKMEDIDMVFAKRFIEKLAVNAIKFYTEYKTEKNLSTVQILQRQTDSVKNLLFGGINDVASINDLNVNPIKQTLRINGQKKQVDLQVNSALYTELLKNLEIAKLTLRKETPLIQVIDTPKLPLKSEKKGRLLMGLIFGFVGFLVASAYYVMKYIVKKSISSPS